MMIRILDTAGLILIALGAYLWAPQLGFVVLGVGLLLLSWKHDEG